MTSGGSCVHHSPSIASPFSAPLSPHTPSHPDPDPPRGSLQPAGAKSKVLAAVREEEVLGLVAKGMVNKEIADQLGISLETVRGHLKNIYMKLHVRSRTAAAMKYFR